MSVLELDECVILPVDRLDAWAAADAEQRHSWFFDSAEDVAAGMFDIGGAAGIAFLRDDPRPKRPLLTYEARRRLFVVVAGDNDEALRLACEEPDDVVELAAEVAIDGPQVVFGLDAQVTAAVTLAERISTPMLALDLEPGAYAISLQSIGTMGKSTYGQVIYFERLED